VEPTKIWSNKTMADLLVLQPKTLADLEKIKGLTKKKVFTYGLQIIHLFNGGQTAFSNEEITSITTANHSIPKLEKEKKMAQALADEPDISTHDEENIDTRIEKVLGVGDYLDYINHILKVVGDVKVIGEISKLTNHPTGVYMTIKDKAGEGVLDCYINPYTYRGLGLPLEEGMEVKVSGIPGIFKRRSQLSLKVEGVELAGEGSLKKAYELMKQKLTDEGIFDRKRELPEFIASLGIITSKTGAVIDDFRNNLEMIGCKLFLKDCRVEGNQSANQIIRAIKYFNIHHPDLDCLVIMRGGGSLEDMQAFNSEAVIKEVFASKIPVIAALGHDRDVPLTCLAADCYTSTPTAAAVLINSTWNRLRQEPDYYQQVILHKFQSLLDEQHASVTNVLHQLTGSFNAVMQQAKHLEEKILRGYTQIINTINQTKQQAQNIMSQMLLQTSRNLQSALTAVSGIEKLLDTVNPERNLKLGYSLAYDNSGKLIRSTAQVKQNDNVQIKLSDGDISTTVN
ncbi:MAG: exodeoxyribonuclease VII large subunit, partial [bacterium]|nr:exodeoxyribonuclease VII large subunit [bacterium]